MTRKKVSSTERLIGKMVDDALEVGIPKLLNTQSPITAINIVAKLAKQKKYKERTLVALTRDFFRAF